MPRDTLLTSSPSLATVAAAPPSQLRAVLAIGAVACALGATAGALPSARAAEPAVQWPTQTVRIVVPAPPASSLDVIARLLAEGLKGRWGQSVVVENKAGAGGMLGVDVAAKAAPDGHTMALGFNGPIAFAPTLYRKMPYDPARDLAPVVMTTSQPNVLAIGAHVPATTVGEFVAWAKARNGKVNYSSLGMGSSAHLTMALFEHEAGFAATHVPFNGSPPAAMALAQGEVDATFMVMPALMAHVRSGKVKLLALSAAGDSGGGKPLPTLAEAGFPQVESLAWNGLFVPAATPAAVVAKINADVNAVLRDPAVRAQLEAQGLSPVGGSAASFQRTIRDDAQRWGAVIRKAGITLD